MTDDLKQHLLPDELALHAAEQAATPGMIEAKYPRSEDFRAVRLFTGTTYLASVCNSDMDEDEIKANADLIALSRNMVPVLLQRLAESRAENVRLMEQLSSSVRIVRGGKLKPRQISLDDESEADHAD